MTGQSLIIAVAVGAVIGLAGRFLACRGRSVPLWLPPSAGIAAAVLATVIARMANAERPGPTPLEIVLQVLFAAAGVAVVAVTADRPSARARRLARDKTREKARLPEETTRLSQEKTW